jgi:lysophospholipase L1-like esterase
MLKKIALMLASTLVALAAAELLVRLTGAAPEIFAIRRGRFQLSPNPKIGYEPAPLTYQGGTLSFYDYLGASNRLGYRDRDHAVAKPAGAYRIVVLGDSIAAGLHIESNEDVFPAVLERLLGDRGLRAEVINLAVSGYNTQQEVETLRVRGLRYQPDLVLVAYTLSSRGRLDGDIMKTLLEDERRQPGVSSVRAGTWLVHSALYRLLRYRVMGAGGRPGSTDEVERYLALVSADTVAPYFGELRQLAHDHHFQVLIAVFPRFVRTFKRYPFGEQHQFVQELARQKGFALVDLLVPFSACRDASAEPISSETFHPTPYGHRCAAEAIAKAVLALPRSGG